MTTDFTGVLAQDGMQNLKTEVPYGQKMDYDINDNVVPCFG